MHSSVVLQADCNAARWSAVRLTEVKEPNTYAYPTLPGYHGMDLAQQFRGEVVRLA